MVTHTFQVSQGSVETLFRRGGKRLHHFSANLFRKRNTKLSPESQEFYRKYLKTFGLFFSVHTVIL